MSDNWDKLFPLRDGLAPDHYKNRITATTSLSSSFIQLLLLCTFLLKLCSDILYLFWLYALPWCLPIAHYFSLRLITRLSPTLAAQVREQQEFRLLNHDISPMIDIDYSVFLFFSIESGCYEVDPGMPVAAINSDHTNVNFKFYSSAECTGTVTYAGTTNGTVITVTEFNAGSVRVTCPRQRRR